MSNCITLLTKELTLKTKESKECNRKCSMLEKRNQEQKEVIRSMEKQKHENKSILMFQSEK